MLLTACPAVPLCKGQGETCHVENGIAPSPPLLPCFDTGVGRFSLDLQAKTVDAAMPNGDFVISRLPDDGSVSLQQSLLKQILCSVR